MPDDLVSISDFARDHRVLKQPVFKIVKRLSIEPEKRRSSTHRGQSISHITLPERNRVLEYLCRSELLDDNKKETADTETHSCVFYLLLLEPTHDPGRFKVGIADIFPERLRQLRWSTLGLVSGCGKRPQSTA
jgi:hypothetical protein